MMDDFMEAHRHLAVCVCDFTKYIYESNWRAYITLFPLPTHPPQAFGNCRSHFYNDAHQYDRPRDNRASAAAGRTEQSDHWVISWWDSVT